MAHRFLFRNCFDDYRDDVCCGRSRSSRRASLAPSNCLATRQDMSSPQEAVRVAIAGAASLRGKELKLWLEESNFPAAEIRLLDEEIMDGTLTEAAGEPAVIETVDEDSFERVRFAFFTGSAKFSARHAMEASRSGAVVIDLSG